MMTRVRTGEVKGVYDRDNDLPSNPRTRSSLQFASELPRPIGTLSRRRHRYNNVACQSIRPISRELKLQRGSFRVNFPAIKTGNVRNCDEIACRARPPPPLLPSRPPNLSPRFRRGARVYHRSRYFHVDANQVTSRRINIGLSPFAKLRVKFSIIDIPLKRAILFGRRGRLKLTYATRE